MAGVNKVILLGNLGSDPEVKYLENGSVVARINLATSESYKDKQGNKQTLTEWHEIELWDGLAKVAEQYLKQGDTIYLEGKIKSNKWTDDQGNNRKSLLIRGINMTMVNKKNSNQSSPGGVKSGGEPDPLSMRPDNGSDDLPF